MSDGLDLGPSGDDPIFIYMDERRPDPETLEYLELDAMFRAVLDEEGTP
jgi:hypothetical protein